MLSKLQKLRHAAKYVYSIQIDRVEPWPCDDLPVCVFWKRGSKKSKKGNTEQRLASHTEQLDGFPSSTGILVQQAFDLPATLYAESKKQKLTGPYKSKDCVFTVVQIAADGSLITIGHATLDLAKVAISQGEMHKEITLVCDNGWVRSTVGNPKLILKCRSWLKASSGPGSMSSFTSGLSALTGFTEETVTHSDFLSSTDQSKERKPGAVAIEQEVTRSALDESSQQLDSAHEIFSPTASAIQEDKASPQDLEDSEKKSSPAEQHLIVASGTALSAITEEGTAASEAPKRVESGELDDSAHSEEYEENVPFEYKSQVVAESAIKACPVSDEHVDASEKTQSIVKPEQSLKTADAVRSKIDPDVSHVVEIASILDDYWMTGRLHHSISQSQKSALKDETPDWWSMVISLLTCVPTRPVDY